MNQQQSRGLVRGRGRYRGRGKDYSSRNSSTDYPCAPNTSRQNINTLHMDTCCSPVTICLEFDSTNSPFFAELRKMWTLVKKCDAVVNMLHRHFNNCNNPYEEAVRLAYNCQDFSCIKTKSLPYFIMEEFKQWSTAMKNRITHLLTLQLKTDVFKIVSKQGYLNFTKLVIEIYEIQEERDIFLKIVKCMVEKQMFREACQNSILLGLQNCFTIEQFLIPLVLQDKLVPVDEFLTSSPAHQTELVSYLDSVLCKPGGIKDCMLNFATKYKVRDVKFEKLHAKPWKKLISRFIKMFKLPDDITPNLNRKRNEGAIQFLLKKKFVEQSLSDESWREMIQEAIGPDEDLQKELIFQLACYAEFSEALHWATFYNVSREDWPHNVVEYFNNPDQFNQKQQRNANLDSENWDEEVGTATSVIYHKYPLPVDTIYLIDSEEKFVTMLETGFQDVDLVGIDCEWKPSFGSQKNDLALLQIATRSKVFIIDVITLGSRFRYLWQQLGRLLFSNSDILKLGFGLMSDFSMIQETLPDVNLNQKVGFLDLISIYKQLDKYPKVVLPHEVHSSGFSLSTLVSQCLGYPLNKSDQFSNWEKRPLRKSQLEYAALDAYCLIQIYDVLRECCILGGFPFDEACYSVASNNRVNKKKSKKGFDGFRKNSHAQDIVQPLNPYTDVPAHHMKLVCDTMLQGLGKNLRRCGIDTVILQNTEDHMECVRYAQDQKRFILTRGTIFNKLVGCVPHGHCLKIISDNVDEQLKEVLDYYKVTVTKEDVFARCQVCNGNSFVKVSRSTMNMLRQQSQPQYLYAEADEATGFSSEDDYSDEPGAPVKYQEKLKSSKPTPTQLDATKPTRKWEFYSDEKIDFGLCQTKLGAHIQVETVPPAMFNTVEMFYVCEECGKVYWDGSHFEKIVTGRLQGIVQ